MKKLLSVLLAVMMLLSAMPVMAEEIHECAGEIVHGEHFACAEDETEGSKAATCTEDGYTEYTCQDPDCVVGTFRVEIPALGHAHAEDAEAVIVTPATCEGEGVREWQKCLNCGKAYTETIKPIGHTWEVKVDAEEKPVVVAPTCTEEGYTVYVCTECGAEKKDDTVAKLGHDWDINPETGDIYFTEEEGPSCAAPGMHVTFTYCARCYLKDIVTEESNNWLAYDHEAILKNEIAFDAETEDEYDAFDRVMAKVVDGIIPGYAVAIDPEYENAPIPGGACGWICDVEVTVVEADCVNTGLLTLECVECDAKVELVLPALGHVYYTEDLEEAAKPTCMDDGKVLVHCEFCDFEEQANIEAPGKHDFENGTSTFSQEKYGASLKKVAFEEIAKCIDATEHVKCAGHTVEVKLSNGDDFDYTIVCTKEFDKPWTATEEHDKAEENYAFRDSTCTAEGYEYFYCNACGYTYGGVIEKKDHNLASKVATKPTCTETGLIIWSCQNEGCTHTEEQIVPATGHNYELIEEKAHTCTVDGYEYFVCSRCGDDYKEVDEDHKAHHVAPDFTAIKPDTNNNQAYKAPTCTATGLQSYECLVCHKAIINEVIPALGHLWTGEIEYADEMYDTYTPATCKNVASYFRACQRQGCKHTETVEVGEKLGHLMAAWNDNEEAEVNSLVLDTSKLPTCTETGKAYYNCVVCGALVENFELPKLPHYEITVWNPEKRVYEVSCEKASWDLWDALMADYLWNEIASCTEDEALAEQVYTDVMNELKAKLQAKNANFIPGIDCDKTTEIKVNPTHYDIALEDGVVTLTPDENCALLKNPMLIVNWDYTLSDGTAFSYTRLFRADDIETLTYDLGLAEAPVGSVLETITVIVTDRATLDITVAAKGYGFAQF